MTAPEITVVPLKQAGESVTMRVLTCALLPFGKYPEVEFTGTDGKQVIAVRVPQKSADRQLTRVALTYETAVGKDLTISRDPNQVDPSKPFWGISRFNGIVPIAPTAEPTAAARPQQCSRCNKPLIGQYPVPVICESCAAAETKVEPPDKLTTIFALQEKCFKHALSLAMWAKENRGIEPTLEGVSALTAQTLIAANQQGVR